MKANYLGSPARKVRGFMPRPVAYEVTTKEEEKKVEKDCILSVISDYNNDKFTSVEVRYAYGTC